MNHFISYSKALLTLCFIATLFSCSKRSGKPKVLVFSKTAAYYHESIREGNKALIKLGQQNDFSVDTTSNGDYFTEDSLKQYSAVVFLSTTGDVLNHLQEAAFERYIQSGGGYLGIHSAADTEYDWGWYGKLVGGYFLDHPGITDTFPNVQEGVLVPTEVKSDASKHLPKEWKRTDEFYSFKKLKKDVEVLLTIDEKSYKGGKNGPNHPMAWFHEYDGGRAFYTALGHTGESYRDESFLKHLLGGLQYAIGKNRKLDYAKAKTGLPPDDDRFTKTQLSQGAFNEPTEMTILPNFDVLIVQRRGEIMLYKNETKAVKQVGFLQVYHQTSVPDVNAEEGILGLAKDPKFAKNNWVYIYYSPAEKSVNRLSRFTFANDTLEKSTEKIILEMESQRQICCHTGGSIAFGPDGLLYLSSGDNSTPFDEKGQRFVNSGYAPLNDQPGHEQYDAARSAGNSADLRGKIIRIRVKEDATYEIPDGNLFPKGTNNTRPEIYVMGNRNPYRISVDQKNSFLYWGEVGPDAKSDSFGTRGPRGYDEVNQARKAGFYGWPFFVGGNYAYHQYDYATGKSGLPFDPKAPVNASRNNTGLRQLPPVAAPFIWYPYDPSPDFPQLGTGGRNAMAGPVYYTDMFPKETRLPEYYNGKLFIYDWIRGWIKAVSMQPNGDFSKMEPFFSTLKVNSLIDMEVGPDGRFYLLEYGNGWFAKNGDAGLARIDYNGGNRPPKVKELTASKTSGLLPFQLKVSVKASDPEKDKVTYKWNMGDGTIKETTVPELAHTYQNAGDFQIYVEVTDASGASVKSNSLAVYAGNEAPEVSVNINGNRSFYFPGMPVQYSVSVKDGRDTASLDLQNLFVSVDYVEGFDKAAAPTGHLQGQSNIEGKNLVLTLDCKSCHKESEKSIGPAYRDIARKYGSDDKARSYLADKIIRGSVGVWGEVAMPAHPSLSQADVQRITSWIVSLESKVAAKKSLPLSGTIVPPSGQDPKKTMVISASYTDKGGKRGKALTGNTAVSLPGSIITFTGNEAKEGFTTYNADGTQVLVFPEGKGWFALEGIDLSGVGAVTLTNGWLEAPEASSSFEVRLDSQGGTLLGKAKSPVPAKGQRGGQVTIPIVPNADGKLHTLYFFYESSKPVKGGVASMQFKPAR